MVKSYGYSNQDKTKTAVKTELQGDGSYKYECDDPECFYCEKLGAKPKVRPLIRDRVKFVKIPTRQYRWTKREVDLLKEMQFMNPRYIVDMFPLRSIKSLYYKKNRIKYELLTIE